MRILLIFILSQFARAEDVQLRYDDLCFGQCAIANTKTSFSSQLSDGRQVSFNFQDGFFHLKNSKGETKHLLSDTDVFDELTRDLKGSSTDESEMIFNNVFDIIFKVDLSKKNNRQAYQQKLFRLEQQKNWCEKNQSLKLKDCQNILNDYKINKELFEANLKSNIVEHELCFKKTSISDVATKILPMTKRVLPLYKSGSEKLSIDGPFCNIAAGLTSAFLDDLGFVRGQDYLFQSGSSHVYLTLPKENKIVDPTFAQFFEKDSPAHQLIMQKSGFVGTPAELFNFLFEHRNDLAYCRDPKKGCEENFYSKQLKGINANSNQLESKAALEKLFKHLFYGENWNPEKKFLIDTAIATSDYFGKNKETYVQSHEPELKQIAAELDAFQCMNKNKVEELVCNDLMKSPNNASTPKLESFTHTVEMITEIINVHEINGLK